LCFNETNVAAAFRPRDFDLGQIFGFRIEPHVLPFGGLFETLLAIFEFFDQLIKCFLK
jgi:hypothetical protein